MVGRAHRVPGDGDEALHPTLIDTPTLTNGADSLTGTSSAAPIHFAMPPANLAIDSTSFALG